MHFKTADEVEREIKRLTDIKNEMREQEAQLTPQKRLAIMLHDKHCTICPNECTWHYYMKNGYPIWNEALQKLYLTKCDIIWVNFKALLPQKSDEDLEKIIANMFSVIFRRN